MAFNIPVDLPEVQFKSHSGGVYRLARHPSRADTFASCSVDTTIKIWRLDSTTPQRTLDGHFGYVLDLRWVPGTDNIVSGSFDGQVRERDFCTHYHFEHKRGKSVPCCTVLWKGDASIGLRVHAKSFSSRQKPYSNRLTVTAVTEMTSYA